MKQFMGTGVALVTPFKSDLSIDFNALERLVSHCIEGGVEYLVVMGTTGENPSLSKSEKKQVLAAVIEAAAGQVPIVYGVGGNNTAALVEELKTEDFKGVDAVLSVSPYYNKPTQEGIYQHYKALSEASPLPIILYNVPGRTGCDMSPATINQLATIDGVIGVKEATADLDRIVPISKGTSDGFILLSGDDFTALPFVLLGGDGVISVTSNFAPKMMSELISAGASGDLAKARELHHTLHPLFHAMFLESNPVPVKTAMEWRKMMGATFRAPLGKMGDIAKEAMVKVLESHPWA